MSRGLLAAGASIALHLALLFAWPRAAPAAKAALRPVPVQIEITRLAGLISLPAPGRAGLAADRRPGPLAERPATLALAKAAVSTADPRAAAHLPEQRPAAPEQRPAAPVLADVRPPEQRPAVPVLAEAGVPTADPGAAGRLLGPGTAGDPSTSSGALAAAGNGERGVGPGSGSSGNSAEDGPLDTAALSRRLQQVALGCYPAAARRFHQAGDAQVRFCLDSAGAVREATIAGSSGSALLDHAASGCVVPGAAPFEPATFGRCFTLPVRFRP